MKRHFSHPPPSFSFWIAGEIENNQQRTKNEKIKGDLIVQVSNLCTIDYGDDIQRFAIWCNGEMLPIG